MTRPAMIVDLSEDAGESGSHDKDKKKTTSTRPVEAGKEERTQKEALGDPFDNGGRSPTQEEQDARPEVNRYVDE